MDVEIRKADRGDTRFLAWVMQEAARSHLERGIMEFLLPDDRQRLDFLDATLWTETRSFFHHQGFLVAEVGGRPVAALSGYEGAGSQELFPVALREAWDELGWAEADFEAMLARLGIISGAFPGVPEDRWIIEWVATLPEHRGRGIVSKLIGATLAEGRERGYARAQVGCFIGNRPAQRAYEREGFAIVGECRDPDWEAELGCPGIYRMHRDL